MTGKIKLGILGATGMAGREAVKHQAYLEQEGENYAELTVVTGGPGSAGRKLGEVFDEKEAALSEAYGFWEAAECPEKYREAVVDEAEPSIVADKADYVISALPGSIAEGLEQELRHRGVHVFSNSSSYRWAENVPLFVPEINHAHVNRMTQQETPGRQANNPNCTTAGYVPIIGVLEESGHSIREIDLTTMQSISGKGDRVAEEDYKMRIAGNVIDDWSKNGFNGEEQKSEIEPQKILGKTRGREETLNQYNELRNGDASARELDIVPVNADTNRVATQYGHLESLVIRFEDEVSAEEVRNSLENWQAPEPVQKLPSTPEKLVEVRETVEPAEDVYAGKGMTVIVGDIRRLGPGKIGLTTLSHNLRRGATWTARQSMELYLREIEGREF